MQIAETSTTTAIAAGSTVDMEKPLSFGSR
jgi:hypothetical protein